MLSEEDLSLVKRLVMETIAEILDKEVWDAIFDLVNGQEAGIAGFAETAATGSQTQAMRSQSPTA